MFAGGLDWGTVAIGGEGAGWVVGALREVGGGRTFAVSGMCWPKYGSAGGNPSISANLRNLMSLFEEVDDDFRAAAFFDFELDVDEMGVEVRRDGMEYGGASGS